MLSQEAHSHYEQESGRKISKRLKGKDCRKEAWLCQPWRQLVPLSISYY
jgi:hypothetical protein